MKRRGTPCPRGGRGNQAPIDHPPTPSPPGTARPGDMRWIATFARSQPSEIDSVSNSKRAFNGVLATADRRSCLRRQAKQQR